MRPEKHLKKIVSRICGGGILSIASLSLVGVGFSSWLITGKDNPTRDTPLDSIGADGEFSDINKYLNLTERNSSDFVWNNKLKCFQAPNNEIKDGYQGKLYLYFSIDTGNDQIQKHLPTKLSTMKVLSNIVPDSSNSADLKTAQDFSSAISEAKLVCSAAKITGTGVFDNNDTILGNRENNSWKETFSVNYSSLNGFANSTSYYFAIRYLFTSNADLDFISSSKDFLASVSRGF